VTGKLVLILDGSPAGYKPSVFGSESPVSLLSKIGKAQEKGAAAVIVINGNYPRKTFNGSSSFTMKGYKSGVFPLSFSAQAVAEKYWVLTEKNS
jgi:hypothetical protein